MAQDPDTGIISYGDTNIRHNNQADVALEFLDFYKETGGKDLKYLVFDSKFTTYENLSKLDDNGIKFITIRRRGKSIVNSLTKLPNNMWHTIRVPTTNGRTRTLKVVDEIISLEKYRKEIRQIAITGRSRIQPALIITNDFTIKKDEVITKYAKRWLIEKGISEQIYFFHLNKVSSSMVIKVDFDLTMTILAHNLFRLFATDMPGYTHNTAQTLYEKFLHNGGNINLERENIIISMKKKRNLPLTLTVMKRFQNCKIPWLNNRVLQFIGSSTS